MSTMNAEQLPGDPAGLLGGQEDDGIGYVFGLETLVAVGLWHVCQRETGNPWSVLFWTLAVAVPFGSVVAMVTANCVRRPRPFHWLSIAIASRMLALCGVAHAALMCRMVRMSRPPRNSGLI